MGTLYLAVGLAAFLFGTKLVVDTVKVGRPAGFAGGPEFILYGMMLCAFPVLLDTLR